MPPKKLRKKALVKVTVTNHDTADRTQAYTPRPSEPAHTATFWRNSYEAERASKELVKRHLMEEREEVARLTAEIESLSKRRPRKRLS